MSADATEMAEIVDREPGSTARARILRSRAQSLRELASGQPAAFAHACERRARQLEAGARLVDDIVCADRPAPRRRRSLRASVSAVSETSAA